METKYLPLGSIVKLKGGTKEIMITGYLVKIKSMADKIFDYKGCPYPEGVLTTTAAALFDNKDIDEVIFEGYKNEESEKFFEEIATIMEDMNN